MCLSIRHLLQAQGPIQTENKGLGKDVPCKQKSKVNGSSNTDIRLKKKKTLKIITRDMEGSIQEDIIIISFSEPYLGAPVYIKQMLLKGNQQ